MTRYFIHMAYDGTAYHGWQIQPNGITVQGMLTKALSTLLQTNIEVIGAGRTDTGVHASFFMSHFDLRDKLMGDPDQLVFKLNRFLPPDIVVYRIWQVPEDSHARFSATYRTYHYHISTLKPLYTRNFTYHMFGSLDVAEISKCCEFLLETEDFTSFSKLHTDVKTNICNVMEASWKEEEHGYLFRIKADRFLRNMVRSLTGTLIDVGQGKIDVNGFKAIVDAKDRGKAGQSMPASGLFLVDIGYEDSSL